MLNNVDRFNIGIPFQCASRPGRRGRPGRAGGGGGASGGGIEVVIQDLMTQETRDYLSDSGPGNIWIVTTMGFESALDENLLVCIQDLVSSGESRGDSKVSVFVGQAYFILLSIFFTNSTLIFVDVNIHLLVAMQNIINNFKDIESFDDLFKNMETVKLRQADQSRHDLDKVIEILRIYNEGELFQICKQNFLNNTYVLCKASITDTPFIDYLKNSYVLDYFSISNLWSYDIDEFWMKLDELADDFNSKWAGTDHTVLFIASNRTAISQIIFTLDEFMVYQYAYTNPNLSIFEMDIIMGSSTKEVAIQNLTQYYSRYDFVKYVYVVRNREPILFRNTL